MPGGWLTPSLTDTFGIPVWKADCTLKQAKTRENSLEMNDKLHEREQRELRSDTRIVVKVPVEIIAVNEEGSRITERTHVQDVSDFGCCFSMQGMLKKGDTVAVQLLAQDGQSLSDDPAKLFEVMWVERRTSSSLVGARILSGEKLDRAKSLQNPGGPKLAAK